MQDGSALAAAGGVRVCCQDLQRPVRGRRGSVPGGALVRLRGEPGGGSERLPRLPAQRGALQELVPERSRPRAASVQQRPEPGLLRGEAAHYSVPAQMQTGLLQGPKPAGQDRRPHLRGWQALRVLASMLLPGNTLAIVPVVYQRREGKIQIEMILTTHAAYYERIY